MLSLCATVAGAVAVAVAVAWREGVPRTRSPCRRPRPRCRCPWRRGSHATRSFRQQRLSDAWEWSSAFLKPTIVPHSTIYPSHINKKGGGAGNGARYPSKTNTGYLAPFPDCVQGCRLPVKFFGGMSRLKGAAVVAGHASGILRHSLRHTKEAAQSAIARAKVPETFSTPILWLRKRSSARRTTTRSGRLCVARSCTSPQECTACCSFGTERSGFV